MKKITIFLATITTIFLVGCGSDRGGNCGENGKEIVYKNPTALIDLSTPNGPDATHYTSGDDKDNNSSTVLLRWFSKDDPIIFDASRSKDLDNAGDSKVTYEWLVKNEDNTTMSDGCIDQNVTDSRLIIKICNEADDREEEKFRVTLKVKDNENKTATDTKIITIY